MNSRFRSPILIVGLPLRTISMDNMALFSFVLPSCITHGPPKFLDLPPVQGPSVQFFFVLLPFKKEETNFPFSLVLIKDFYRFGVLPSHSHS